MNPKRLAAKIESLEDKILDLEQRLVRAERVITLLTAP